GCGGGRYTIAMSRLGAGQVTGCDISDDGLADARLRADGVSNVSFKKASALDLPFEDESFDFVCCSGVLHHTEDPDKGLDELTRVLRPKGKLYLLLYGTGGLRWAASDALRPIAQELGYDFMDRAVENAGLSPNNRAAIMDDFFVPIFELVDWPALHNKLRERDFVECQRWGKGKFDHEANIKNQREELDKLARIFSSSGELVDAKDGHLRRLTEKGLSLAKGFVARIDELVSSFEKKQITVEQLEWEIIGEGHHRVIARKSGS
ncbi:MAG: class I SAM-dependent methyltransferase, partial [Alphaproteobacteria bacterium]|nr:class I SAM-dependent methyltransferase [Alphaproteobacteria bacterium]